MWAKAAPIIITPTFCFSRSSPIDIDPFGFTGAGCLYPHGKLGVIRPRVRFVQIFIRMIIRRDSCENDLDQKRTCFLSRNPDTLRHLAGIVPEEAGDIDSTGRSHTANMSWPTLLPDRNSTFSGRGGIDLGLIKVVPTVYVIFRI